MGKPTLIISLDFELFWGVQDAYSLNEYSKNVLGGRTAIPKLLDLFDKHGIHATWSTVGYLFGKSKEDVCSYFPASKPSYDNAKLSTYHCFEHIGDDEDTAPCFFGSSLVDLIASMPGQELGSHTFSHYYCKETGQTTDQFREDINAALAIAASAGYYLNTAVFPRNQCTLDHIKVLSEFGFIAYRDEENDWIHKKIDFRPLMRALRLADVYLPLTGQGGYIPQVENGMVNLVGSRMYKPYFKPLALLEPLKIIRIKKQMLHAAKNGLTFHLWWHPHNIGVRTDFHLQQLEEIFSYYDKLKGLYGMRSMNMREAAEEILNRG